MIMGITFNFVAVPLAVGDRGATVVCGGRARSRRGAHEGKKLTAVNASSDLSDSVVHSKTNF